jgi:signal transduction histidine kinase
MAEKQAFSAEVADKRTNKVIRITTFPYLSPGGDIIGSIHVSRDVTEEKEREMRLIMTERLAALGQMASGIAHEINNPLASIAGCSEGLLSRIKKGQCDYKLFETYLNIIQEEIFRCKSITTAMLSFVRKTTYEKKAVNIIEMLDRTIEVISYQGRLKDVNIVRNYAADTPVVQANEGELRQVCLAVMANALDAMEDEGTLTLETGTSGSGAFIRIGDTGSGIPGENLARIFDPFYTTKAEKGGTGLGLSIARKIIHNQNGTIEVSSEPGKGSVFTIKLPL